MFKYDNYREHYTITCKNEDNLIVALKNTTYEINLDIFTEFYLRPREKRLDHKYLWILKRSRGNFIYYCAYRSYHPMDSTNTKLVFNEKQIIDYDDSWDNFIWCKCGRDLPWIVSWHTIRLIFKQASEPMFYLDISTDLDNWLFNMTSLCPGHDLVRVLLDKGILKETSSKLTQFLGHESKFNCDKYVPFKLLNFFESFLSSKCFVPISLNILCSSCHLECEDEDDELIQEIYHNMMGNVNQIFRLKPQEDLKPQCV